MPRQEDISRKPSGQRVESRRLKTFIPILLSVGEFFAETPFQNEEDFSQLADELEKNPPSWLTRKDLSLLVQVLRS